MSRGRCAVAAIANLRALAATVALLLACTSPVPGQVPSPIRTIVPDRDTMTTPQPDSPAPAAESTTEETASGEKKARPVPFVLPDEAALARLPEFNRFVLREAARHPADGTHAYWWPKKGEGAAGFDGVTTDCLLAGVRVLRGEPRRRTYCCGYTLEVFLNAYKQWLAAQAATEAQSLVSPREFSKFKLLWFVEKKLGPGPSAALEKYKLGRTIPSANALPGDFVQIWRTPDKKGIVRGHSVVFLEWVRDAKDRPTAMRYWSSNEGTNGLSVREEHIGGLKGVDLAHTHFARVDPAAAPPTRPAAAARQ